MIIARHRPCFIWTTAMIQIVPNWNSSRHYRNHSITSLTMTTTKDVAMDIFMVPMAKRTAAWRTGQANHVLRALIRVSNASANMKTATMMSLFVTMTVKNVRRSVRSEAMNPRTVRVIIQPQGTTVHLYAMSNLLRYLNLGLRMCSISTSSQI